MLQAPGPGGVSSPSLPGKECAREWGGDGGTEEWRQTWQADPGAPSGGVKWGRRSESRVRGSSQSKWGNL